MGDDAVTGRRSRKKEPATDGEGEAMEVRISVVSPSPQVRRDVLHCLHYRCPRQTLSKKPGEERPPPHTPKGDWEEEGEGPTTACTPSQVGQQHPTRPHSLEPTYTQNRLNIVGSDLGSTRTSWILLDLTIFEVLVGKKLASYLHRTRGIGEDGEDKDIRRGSAAGRAQLEPDASVAVEVS
ncbi:hypothetical protein CRG98_036299 [Punica granatum]|uniref:Uncharacterized protein n=1 Tax=Punica granatum TaxID=22663 RepID=A0A2I0IH38_PUNGR|nr:hypothetical protein CRG98_036299 [Punica granatum]